MYTWLAYLRQQDRALAFVCAGVHSSLATGTKHAPLYRRVLDLGLADFALSPVIFAGELLLTQSGDRLYNFSSGHYMQNRFDNNNPAIELHCLAPFAESTILSGWRYSLTDPRWASEAVPLLSLPELLWLADHGVRVALYETPDDLRKHENHPCGWLIPHDDLKKRMQSQRKQQQCRRFCKPVTAREKPNNNNNTNNDIAAANNKLLNCSA
eukprot:TRINITY_DN111_c0_g1_i2.p2 TRINITY_DN111_c0_g1~~TRINITY_DN111_c0_g1_i2.p2  ORF type:complete len:211 (+),score=49.44 TRINITY_DN111_c0_g1_i2:792-1424(+)